MKLKLALAGLMIAIAPTIAFAEGDAVKGKKVFKKCKSCHKIQNGDEVIFKGGKIGPNLYGVIGRAAGSVEGYKYSKGKGKGMLAKAEEIGKWDEAKLDAFLKNPKKYLGGKSKMSLKLKKDKQRANVIAFLKSVGPAE